MAKKVKEAVMPAAADTYKPRLYLQLEGQDVGQIKSLKVGEKIELRVTGKVVGLAQRERPDYNNEKKTIKTGDIDLEGYRVQVLGDEDNEFEKLSED